MMAKISNSIEMMNNDVCFQTDDDRRFRLRAAAIIIENGCVLFATNDVEKYYYSNGAKKIKEKFKKQITSTMLGFKSSYKAPSGFKYGINKEIIKNGKVVGIKQYASEIWHL